MNDNENKPIPVDGNVTPITKKEIKNVTAHQWSGMSISQLYEQLSIMSDRLFAAHEMKNPVIIKQIQQGIDNLQRIINSKGSKF